MYKSFFTLPDLDLIQESSVDPMGLQVIWTSYGQKIFDDKLTTIANDLRVFTFNLFHNHLINRLYQEHVEELQEAKQYYKSWQTESDVKTGLLMFLEDLVIHVFYNNVNDNSNVEKLGLLGLSKAKSLYNSYKHDEIFLAAYKRSGVLRNQLNLGMTGRYKGPMMNMLFFDRSFNYTPKTWEPVNKFMINWLDAIKLEDNILKLIINHLFESGNKEYPQLSFQELKSCSLWKPIVEGYLGCFGSSKLPRDIKDYWRKHLGLMDGAPATLYNEISKLKFDEPINHYQIFLKAKKYLINEPSEQVKLEDILSIEPFLSHSEFLLRYLAMPGVKSIRQEEKNLELLRNEIILAGSFSVEDVQPRLKELRNVMLGEGSIIEWVKRIIEFHKNIMHQRGGSMWIELDQHDNVKHYFAPKLSDYLNTIPKYLKEKPWWHRYYLETLRSIYQGLN